MLLVLYFLSGAVETKNAIIPGWPFYSFMEIHFGNNESLFTYALIILMASFFDGVKYIHTTRKGRHTFSVSFFNI